MAHQPGLPLALEALIEAGPSVGILPRRCVGSAAACVTLVKALAAQGFTASQRVVANLLRDLQYSCQSNRKTREGSNHPDRDAQFAHINATVKAALAAGEPAISVDTKKKELVGDLSKLIAIVRYVPCLALLMVNPRVGDSGPCQPSLTGRIMIAGVLVLFFAL